MGLKEDVLAGIAEILGAESAKQVVGTFDDPKRYPQDFIDEYLFFMQKLIGAEAAEQKASSLYKKYRMKQPGTKAVFTGRAPALGCLTLFCFRIDESLIYDI